MTDKGAVSIEDGIGGVVTFNPSFAGIEERFEASFENPEPTSYSQYLYGEFAPLMEVPGRTSVDAKDLRGGGKTHGRTFRPVRQTWASVNYWIRRITHDPNLNA